MLDILNNPDITIGIIAYKQALAKDFLKQIKLEFESNKLLIKLFPEILYDNPQQQSPKWNEEGLIVKRSINPKEATVEAHGLDSQPTGKHFLLCLYDDVVTRDSVATPEQIKKTTENWELSLNLSSEGGIRRYIGTRYHYDDTYKIIIERNAAKPRIYPATDDGTPTGKPVLWTQEYLDERRRTSGPYVFNCQMLQNPKADDVAGFKEQWLRFYPGTKFHSMNKYIFVDPASSKAKSRDYTAIIVIGMAHDENYYIIDAIRKRNMTLTDKALTLMSLVRTYRPTYNNVYYEEYSMQADIGFIQKIMEDEQFRFTITPLGGKVKKEERIRSLIPLFEQGRVYIPDKMMRANEEGVLEDLTQVFIRQEYLPFPYSTNDDLLDALSRITDQKVDIRPPAEERFQEADYIICDNDYDY